ncbi:uncharacterized protein MONOS_15810 [Monocercomonoides exilis]|uniref:uncharacterized protein n=1 Tax=Monocercomonoides exilis TaxID=2049356 RepID=UPI0035597452|nr:hypothetical protein MONOS_15810 [Monocercomonoides exilis]|eukprot:MONOS_15810.1-p1 / transcript=MONOS_15810.1 / gene=MONOS_15810 / organism=Monocercomonoides_exilis_PA203 / gene_product=unspecified product / transcript_product=unspecified product / location=Mono_scaffold01362:292-783(+) / protein_length=100 / sequence_SO=supercontig / SO=protein_coding / is_pseudo=false
MVAKEFLNVVSEEWEVNEEGWKTRKFVELEKMHAVLIVCGISSAFDDSAVERVLQQRVRAHGGEKAERMVLEAEWRDRGYMSQDAEKEVLLEFLESKNL